MFFAKVVKNIKKINLEMFSEEYRILKIEQNRKQDNATKIIRSNVLLGLPPELEHVQFVVNSPFIFSVVKGNGVPIFYGVVKNPS